MTEKVTIELIQKRVGERYGLRDRDLKLRSNAKAIAFPRQVAMYLARQLTAASLPEIGRQFGGKHHTTVMHSINKVEGLRRSDKELDRTISCLLDSFEIALSLSSVPTDSVLTPTDSALTPTDSVLTLTDSALTRAEVDSLLRSPHGFIANSNLRKHRFPRLVPSIRAIDLPLPVRVQNCWQHLKKVHGLTELSDLSRFTLGELLHLKNFGRKSLLDLLSAVFPVILDHPESTVGVATVALPPMDRALSHAEVQDLLRFPDKLTIHDLDLLKRRFPQIAPAVRISDLSLSVRVGNCLRVLKELHAITELSDLSHFTIGELLDVKNFGRKSLLDLLSAVFPVILDHSGSDVNIAIASVEQPGPSAPVTAAAERLRSQPYSARIRCTDPRFRSELGSLLFIANSSSDDPALGASTSLHEVAHRIAGRTREDSPEDTLNVIRKLRYKIAHARRLPLEQELEQITQVLVAGRNINVTLSFFGWSGYGAKTLQAIGDVFHLTRERVRQVTSKFRKKAQQVHPFTPTLKRTITHISHRLPATVDDIESEIHRAGLTQSIFRLDGVVTAAEILGISIPFVIEDHHGIRTVVRHEDAGLARSIVRLARKSVSHAGLGKVSDLCDQIQEEGGTSIGHAVVKHVLRSLRSLHSLDEQLEWFFLDDVPRNPLVTLVTKVLSVAPRIHVTEMRAAIASDQRRMGFAPPKSVVLEFCRTACDCNIEGEHLIANSPPSVTEVLSKNELLTYSVLADKGPLLHRADFEQRCLERGMNRITFSIYLKRAPILARYGPAVYGLRGAPIVPGDVERCIPPRMQRLRDHGWTTNAMPWLAVELSPASLSSGVIAVPPGIQRFIAGRHLLRMLDGSEVGTLVVSDHAAWGLGPLFRRRGGESGDVVVLTFDLQRHEAAVRVGTKEEVFTSAEGLGTMPALG